MSHVAQRADGVGAVNLRLLGSFCLERDSARVRVAPAGQRVLAFLAVLGGSAHRSCVAGTLWSDRTQERSLSNLRSAMWRLPKEAADLVQRQGTSMELSPTVIVDVAIARELSGSLSSGDSLSTSMSTVVHDFLTRDVLPSMDEEWLVVPREQHRQRRLHALEALAVTHLERGRPLDAVDVALAAVAAEPLRESAQFLVVRSHLAAGNRAAALDHYECFSALLAETLGVVPSSEMIALMATSRAHR